MYARANPVKYKDPSGYSVDCGIGEGDCKPGRSTPSRAGRNTPPPPYLPTPTPQPPTPPLLIPATNNSTPSAPSYLPAPTNTPTQQTNPQNSEPEINYRLEVNIDWTKVDYIDAAIDVAGLVGDVASLFQPEGSIPYLITEGAEALGFFKSVADLVSGDPSNMLLQQTTTTAERVIVMVARLERLAPAVGFAGNLVSLWINLKPDISITVR